LTSGPHLVCPSIDGVDDIIGWYRCDGVNKAVLENIEPALSRRQPGAAYLVDIYGAVVFETTIGNG
jgi:hypothetical protein